MADQPEESGAKIPDMGMNLILKNAAACLTHVRTVIWGEGTAAYEIDDGRARLLVTISVRTLSEAKGKPAERIDTP